MKYFFRKIWWNFNAWLWHDSYGSTDFYYWFHVHFVWGHIWAAKILTDDFEEDFKLTFKRAREINIGDTLHRTIYDPKTGKLIATFELTVISKLWDWNQKEIHIGCE